MLRSPQTPKPWDDEYFTVESAARYLKITPKELVGLMCGRKVRKIRNKEDFDYHYDETRFKWEEVYQMRCKLDEQRKIEKGKPVQLEML
jgi:hypothetical protein